MRTGPAAGGRGRPRWVGGVTFVLLGIMETPTGQVKVNGVPKLMTRKRLLVRASHDLKAYVTPPISFTDSRDRRAARGRAGVSATIRQLIRLARILPWTHRFQNDIQQLVSPSARS
jgi:hypothetical protein